MRLLETFKNSATSIFQDGFEEIKRMMDGIDTSKIVDSMIEFNNSIKEEFTKFKERIKNLNDKFIVDVPYDRDEHILSYVINNDELKITIKSDPDSLNQMSEQLFITTIPQDVDVTKLKTKYDDETKTMFFIFKKFKDEVVNDGFSQEEGAMQEVSVGKNTFATTTNNTACTETNTVQESSIFDNKHRVAASMKRMKDEGMSYRKIAKEFGVSDKTAARWIKEFEGTIV